MRHLVDSLQIHIVSSLLLRHVVQVIGAHFLYLLSEEYFDSLVFSYFLWGSCLLEEAFGGDRHALVIHENALIRLVHVQNLLQRQVALQLCCFLLLSDDSFEIVGAKDGHAMLTLLFLAVHGSAFHQSEF